MERRRREVDKEKRKFLWEAVCWNHVIFQVWLLKEAYTGESQGYVTHL